MAHIYPTTCVESNLFLGKWSFGNLFARLARWSIISKIVHAGWVEFAQVRIIVTAAAAAAVAAAAVAAAC